MVAIVATLLSRRRDPCGTQRRTVGRPYSGENSNAAPVAGPDGRLWFDIALQPDNNELGALVPTTGKVQRYPLPYEPSGATLNYEGPIALDRSGHVWLEAGTAANQLFWRRPAAAGAHRVHARNRGNKAGHHTGVLLGLQRLKG